MNALARWVRAWWWAVLVAIVATAAMAVVLVLLFGAVADRNRARDSFEATNRELDRQTLVIERDLLALRLRAEQTADCPVLYLRDLLSAVEARTDLREVQVPEHCLAQDAEQLRSQLANAEKRLADLTRRQANGR